MRRLLIAGALAALMIVPQTHGWAEEGFTPAQKEELREMLREMLQEQAGQRRMDMPAGRPPTRDTEEMPGMGDTTRDTPRYGKDFSSGSTMHGGRTIYAKPFVRAPKTIVGGYMDFTITDCDARSRDCSQGLEFDQERFVPFFYSQVTDRLSVAAEVEIEHGGPQGNQDDGDVKIEFATMDYRFTDWFNLRSGIILIPMGRFNLLHDSPLNDLPLRPLVSRLILPSTFAESGVGFFGTVYPTQLSKVDYEFYVTQGFLGEDGNANGNITEGGGLRSARGSFKADNNGNKAIVSRVSLSPFLGVEVAGSIHYGTWDDESRHDLTLLAVDGTLQRGPFELQGEAAWANIEGGSPNAFRGRAATRTMPAIPYVPPANMRGYYVQLNYHFLPQMFRNFAPTYFTDASTFTGILRWGQVDTNTGRKNLADRSEIDRLTLGLNFRPTEDSVMKFAYTFNTDPGRSSSNPRSLDTNGWQISAATYF